MCHVLEAKLGGSRVLLMFDDVHWMDASSWQLLASAVDRIQPMLAILTSRPIIQSGDLPPELKLLKHRTEKLAELTRTDIEELMRSFLCVSGRVNVVISTSITTK